MGGPFPQSDFVFSVAEDSGGSPGSYTDYSVDAVSFTPSGGERTSGSIHTAGRDTPHVTAGKRNAVTWAINVLYKTGVADLYPVLRGYFEAKTVLWLQYVPAVEAGDDTGFEVGPGILTACPPPAGTASSGESFAVEASFLAEADSIVTV
jgi:hypothetical protein